VYVTMNATQRLRGALWAFAAASTILTSTGLAGVHQTACSSLAPAASAAAPLHQPEFSGLGLLAVVRHVAQVESRSALTLKRLLQGHTLSVVQGSSNGLPQDRSTRSQGSSRGLSQESKDSKGIEQLRSARQESLSDDALRERIARYRVSPEPDQRHAALPNSAQAHCAD
jgi:hypothetical protein